MIPVDARVPRARAAPAVFAIASWAGSLAPRRARAARRRPCGRRGSLRPRTTGARRTGSESTRSSQAVEHEPRGHRSLRLDRNERRAVLGVRLRAPGEPPRPSRRAPRAVASPRRRRVVRAPRTVPAGHAAARYGLWLFYAASPEEAAAAEGALGDAADSRRRYFAVRSRTPLAPRALVREGLGCGSRGSARCRSTGGSTSSCSPTDSALARHLRSLRRSRRPGDLTALAARQDAATSRKRCEPARRRPRSYPDRGSLERRATGDGVT